MKLVFMLADHFGAQLCGATAADENCRGIKNIWDGQRSNGQQCSALTNLGMVFIRIHVKYVSCELQEGKSVSKILRRCINIKKEQSWLEFPSAREPTLFGLEGT
ncbi:hypothetical protein O0L34_g11421 [Tuta absoluta]|nr:hypothetical protein O0L34_g11421 [Tuta absoluta]